MNLFRYTIRLTSASETTMFRRFYTSATNMSVAEGDLNNTAAERIRKELEVDSAYLNSSFAIPKSQDDAGIRERYRPFLLDEETSASDWISRLELSTALKMVEDQIVNNGQERLKVLVLHGSMRNR